MSWEKSNDGGVNHIVEYDVEYKFKIWEMQEPHHIPRKKNIINTTITASTETFDTNVEYVEF